MKNCFTVLTLAILFVILPLSLYAQIPNPSFEQWTDGNPDGWFTSNLFGVITNITQSTSSQSGSYALRGEAITYLTNPYAPTIIAGSYGEGVSVTQRHAALTGYYQFTPVEGDKLVMAVTMWQDATLLGVGQFETSSGTSSYTQFTANIQYVSSGVPNLCEISFTILGPSDSNCHLGSVILIDNLSFSGTTAVQNHNAQSQFPDRFTLGQNYPNPFNPSCVIEYAVPEISKVSIRVYNIMGREITTLFQGVNVPGIHKVTFQPDQLPCGLYFYQMTATSLKSSKMFNQVKKAMYIK